MPNWAYQNFNGAVGKLDSIMGGMLAVPAPTILRTE